MPSHSGRTIRWTRPSQWPSWWMWLELTKELDFLGNTEGDTRIPAMQAVVKWLEGDA